MKEMIYEQIRHVPIKYNLETALNEDIIQCNAIARTLTIDPQPKESARPNTAELLALEPIKKKPKFNQISSLESYIRLASSLGRAYYDTLINPSETNKRRLYATRLIFLHEMKNQKKRGISLDPNILRNLGYIFWEREIENPDIKGKSFLIGKILQTKPIQKNGQYYNINILTTRYNTFHGLDLFENYSRKAVIFSVAKDNDIFYLKNKIAAYNKDLEQTIQADYPDFKL